MDTSQKRFFTFLLLLGMAQLLRAQCTTFAGTTFGNNSYVRCKQTSNNGLFINFNTNSTVLDANDTWALVLHDGTANNLGVIAHTFSTAFVHLGNIEVGTYRIAAIAGNSLAPTGGVVDLTDPCLSVTDVGTLTVNAQPELNIIGVMDPIGCNAPPLNLSADIIGAILFPPMTFTWTLNGEQISNNQDASISRGGELIVEAVSTDYTCLVSDTFVIEGNRADIVFDPVCGGGAVARNLFVEVDGPAPVSYDWSFGTNQPTVSVGPASGEYCVTVTDADGCTLTDCIAVPEMVGTAPFDLVYNDLQGVCIDSIEHLYVNFPNNAWNQYNLHNFLWSTGSTYGYTSPEAAGTYTVTVTNITNGCSQVQSYVVETPGCAAVSGQVFADLNGNCVFDDGDVPLSNYIIIGVLLGSTVQVYAITDANGNYSFNLEPGAYSFALSLPNNLWTPCQGTYTQLVEAGSSYTFPFALQVAESCPDLQVDLGNLFLRRCFGSSYHIQYQNWGTATAENTYIELALDDFLAYNSSSVPGTDIGNNTIRFDLGDVPVNGSGIISVNVYVSCEAELGQSHCTEATIFPHDPCPTAGIWGGAQVELKAICGDSLRFEIKNIGNATMTVPLDYVVIEDAIMKMWPTNATTLDPGISMPIAVPANGATWRLETNQEPFAPAASRPTLVVEGCSTDGNFSTGFVNQLSLNDEEWRDTECTENVGAYDPNDKQGFPTGYGSERYIRRGDELEYLIRFQNTGTDTAFTVVIRDTLSSHFDFTTLRAGASSHPYRLESYGIGTQVKFVFDNINLPDSNTNLAASTGFVSFRIRQKNNLPLGTLLNNSAAIYFDFNEPIITNTTQHRIGDNFIAVVSTWFSPDMLLAVRVWPNPTADVAYIDVTGLTEPFNNYQVDWVDALGRVVRTEQATQWPLKVQRGDLLAGTYALRISDSAQQLQGLVKLNIR
jgi:uncharacterized repeat protein (TIGR01451 family)